MTVTFVLEKFDDVIEDLKPIVYEHWNEVGAGQGKVFLDPDYSFYKKASDSGKVVFYTARENGELVGYAVYFINSNPNARNTLWAVSAFVGVRPDMRKKGIGSGLLNLAERDLKNRGAVVMQTMTKVAHPALSRLLEANGHTQEDVTYTKFIG
jgi:GNAT superfamily N-acetyltransferase